MRYFTKAQIEEIASQLATKAMKDSDFEQTESVAKKDFLVVVQNGINKKMRLSDFIADVIDGVAIIDGSKYMLYDYEGEKTDGSMTQRSVTEALDSKIGKEDIELNALTPEEIVELLDL